MRRARLSLFRTIGRADGVRREKAEGVEAGPLLGDEVGHRRGFVTRTQKKDFPRRKAGSIYNTIL